MINQITNEMMPNDQDVSFYQTNGYWIAPKVMSDERMEQLRLHMEMVYHEQYDTGRPNSGGWSYRTGDPNALRKTDSVHYSDTLLYGLATDPVIGAIASKLTEVSTIRLFDTQLLHKPGRARSGAKANVNVGWHQDYTYWKCCAEPTLLTAWVAFDDVYLANGCMQVVPRSNQWGLVNISDFFEQNLQKQEEAFQVPAGEKFEPLPLIMKAGQISFHHCYTIHGSGSNSTDHPRRSLAIHLLAGENTYVSAGPNYDHYPIRLAQMKTGDPFSGEHFPVLYNS